MDWAIFAAESETDIIFQHKLHKEQHQTMLSDILLPVALLITSGDWTFQQDKSSVHQMLDKVK